MQLIPPAILALLAGAAARKGLLGGGRADIWRRLGEFAHDLPGGLGLPADGTSPEDKALLAAGSAAGTAAAGDEPTVRDIGAAFERSRFPDAAERKQQGSFYTPEAVIDRILDLVWQSAFPSSPAGRDRSRASLLDPAMGCGFFLVRAAERLLMAHRPGTVRRLAANFYGVDSDPAAVFMARALLWLALSDAGGEFLPDPARLVCADSLLGPAFGQSATGQATGRTTAANKAGLSWAAAFPDLARQGGFDVIVGNPPYEVLTNFQKYPARRALARAIQSSGFYSVGTAGGQTNLYRVFCERSLGLLRQGGLLSFVVPLSLTRDAAARPLRRRLLEQEAAADWILFGEDARLFPGVTQSACIFRARKGGGRAERMRVHAMAASAAQTNAGRVEISLSEIEANSGGALTIPFLTGREAELWRWVQGHCPGRLADASEMRVGEVDQTVFRDCMVSFDTGCVLARGRHLSAFRLDARAVPGKERFLLLDRFLEKKGASAAATVQRTAEWRVAQLGIRNLHSRPRLVAALAPPGVYLGNSLNYYIPKPGTSLVFLAGVLNSRLLDWLFRLASGNNNINLHEMRPLPFPSGAAPRQVAAVEAAYTAAAAAAEIKIGTGIETEIETGESLAAARARLDAAVEACYRLPAALAAALAQ